MIIKWGSYEVDIDSGVGVFIALKDECDVDKESTFRAWNLLSMDEKYMIKVIIDMIERNMTHLIHDFGPRIIEDDLEQRGSGQAQA